MSGDMKMLILKLQQLMTANEISIRLMSANKSAKDTASNARFCLCYPRRARSALGVDTVLTLDVCMYVCMYVCLYVCMLGL